MVLIDMDMPENCGKCPLLPIHKDLLSERSLTVRPPDFCPLRPVVTCGECKHCERGGNEAKLRVPCMDTTYPNDLFCGRGEKTDALREGEP